MYTLREYLVGWLAGGYYLKFANEYKSELWCFIIRHAKPDLHQCLLCYLVIYFNGEA